MRVKNSNLEWNVLYYDSNTREIKNYNVLYGIAEEIHIQIKKKKIYDMNTLREFLKREFMYHYWSKAECEILVSGLSREYDPVEKIDMWRQIEMNFDRIVEYINIKCDLKY